MKKLIPMLVVGLIVIGVAYASNQYNWGTSTGGSWSTPDDTTVKAGAALQIGSGGGANVITSGSYPLGIPVTSTQTLVALTPPNTGYIAMVTNGLLKNEICVSTGVLASQWAILQTSAPTNSLLACQ